MPKRQPPDYDSPWKEALEHYFRPFLALCFPWIEKDIDWSRGVEFLDKELQRVVRNADQGRGHVDKLVRVWRLSGEQAWILIHVEVQSEPQPEFGERMYRYNHRISDRYNMLVVSLGVLADDRPDWRPSFHWREAWRFRAGIEFPIVKLLDFLLDRGKLEESSNLFSVIILAHLDALATRSDPNRRRSAKLELVKALYRRGLTREDILELFRPIDWLMALPPDVEEQFRVDLDELEEKNAMPYVTSIERIGIQKGIEQGIGRGVPIGMQRSLLVSLEAKFQKLPEDIVNSIQAIDDPDHLGTLQQRVMGAQTLEDFREALQANRE